MTTPRRPDLTVTFVNDWCAVLTGPAARRLLVNLRGGRAPVWSSRPRGWATTPDVARDALALAQARGIRVAVLDDVDQLDVEERR